MIQSAIKNSVHGKHDCMTAAMVSGAILRASTKLHFKRTYFLRGSGQNQGKMVKKRSSITSHVKSYRLALDLRGRRNQVL